MSVSSECSRDRRRVRRALALVFVLIFTLVLAAGAAPGSLDATFSGDGIALVADSNYYSQLASAVAVQEDGKIVLGGSLDAGTTRIVLVRLKEDGSLDSSFGNNGTVMSYAGLSGGAQVSALALLPDGKILVGATARRDIYSGCGDFLVLRFTAAGASDTTFATTNQNDVDFQNGLDCLAGMALQPDGKIVVVGSSSYGPSIALVRFTPDGSLDATFGSAGKVLMNVWPNGAANGVVVLPDGKLLVAGAGYDVSTNIQGFALYRFNADGSLDRGWGSYGRVITPFGDVAYTMALQPDGKIVAAGVANAASSAGTFALARYDANGRLDTSFGTNGTVTTKLGTSSRITSIAIQADGRIVAGGTASVGGSEDSALARYNSDGSLDTSFGTGGTIITAMSSSTDRGNAVALQQDGKILLAGSAYFTVFGKTVGDVAAARYEVAATGTATIEADAAVTIQGVTITNHSTSACAVTVTRTPVPGGGLPADPGEMPVTWKITTTCTGYTFDLTFAYTDVELANGKAVTESQLKAYRVGAKGTYGAVPSTVDVAANTVTATGVTQLDYWTLASSQPLAVDLADFHAGVTNSRAALTWETVSEEHHAGFNVYRGETVQGPWVKVNEALIPSAAPGSSEGRVYTWTDPNPLPRTAWYLLEDLDLSGAAVKHGPVQVGLDQPTAVSVSAFHAQIDWVQFDWSGLLRQLLGR